MSKGRLDLAALGFSEDEQAWLRGLSWSFSGHLNAADGHTIWYEVPLLGMTMSKFSPKGRRGGKAVCWFTLRGDEKRYDTLADTLRAARERGTVARAMRFGGPAQPQES